MVSPTAVNLTYSQCIRSPTMPAVWKKLSEAKPLNPSRVQATNACGGGRLASHHDAGEDLASVMWSHRLVSPTSVNQTYSQCVRTPTAPAAWKKLSEANTQNPASVHQPMAQNGSTWPKMAHHGSKWLSWLIMAQNGSMWLAVAQIVV